jgi:hypothetical protein
MHICVCSGKVYGEGEATLTMSHWYRVVPSRNVEISTLAMARN